MSMLGDLFFGSSPKKEEGETEEVKKEVVVEEKSFFESNSKQKLNKYEIIKMVKGDRNYYKYSKEVEELLNEVGEYVNPGVWGRSLKNIKDYNSSIPKKKAAEFLLNNL